MTNWSGVWMLLNPVRFACPGCRASSRWRDFGSATNLLGIWMIFQPVDPATDPPTAW